MGKVLTFVDSQRKNHILNYSDVGIITDISSNQLDIADIAIGDIKNLLGENQYGLSYLNKSTNINKWAMLKPGMLDALNSFNMKDPTIYKLGDFAGYNHQALTPSITFTTLNYNFTQNQSVPITISFNLGEADFGEDGNVTHLYVKIDTTYYSLALDPAMFFQSIDFNYQTSGTSNYTKTIYVYFGWSSNKEKIAFPVTPTVTLNLNYLSAAAIGQAIVDTTGLDLDYNYSAWMINKSLTGSSYSFDVRIDRSNQVDSEWYNDTWDIKELLNGNTLISSYFIDSVNGYVTVSGTLPYTPSAGDNINIEFKAS